MGKITFLYCNLSLQKNDSEKKLQTSRMKALVYNMKQKSKLLKAKPDIIIFTCASTPY